MVLAHAFALLGILWGTVTDIRTREVPDWVNYSLIASGFGIAIISSAAQASFSPLLSSVAGFIVAFAVGAAMYYTGQWGGGDSKMIMGLGALFGLPIGGWQSAPFLLVFLLATVFMGAAYGLGWMTFLFIKHRKPVLSDLRERLHQPRIMRIRMFVMGSLFVIAAASLALPWPFMILVLMLAALSYLTFFLTFAVKSVEKVCFVKERRLSELVEGDWIVGEVKRGDKVLVPEGNPGLTKEQMRLLKKHKVRKVTVKEGIPFVPSFLMAYILASWWIWKGLPVLFWV